MVARGLKSKYDQAVEDLRKYFGVLSQDDLFNILSGNSKLDDQKKVIMDMVDNGIKPTAGVASLIQMFQSQETAYFTHEIVENINKFLENSSPESKKIVEDTFLIVNEDTKSKLPNAEKCVSETSINLLTSPPDIPQNFKSINEAPENPSKDKPGLSAFVIKPNSLNPSKRGDSGIEIFLNAIPTIEMSRCVPFLDITLIPPTPALTKDGIVQTISILQFLKGNFKPAGGSADETMAKAVDLRVKQNVLNTPPPKVADAKEREKEPDKSSAGMEIFTMPQTMVSGDEAYTSGTPGTRAAPVLDRFRPFMSIKDFKVDLAPSAGLLTFKTASLSLILHDRSRLSEISEFVKPDLYGKTEMLITYGWSHPDGDLPGNVYGRFLDSLKVTEKYGIVNSSFTFDDVGQVSVSLKLSLKGSAQLELTKISEGEGVKGALEEVKRLTELIKAQRKKISGGKKGSKKLDGGSILSKLSDTGSAMGFTEETSKKIDEFINSARTSQSKDVKAIIPLLEGLKDAAPEAQDNMASLVSKKVGAVSSNRLTSLEEEDIAIFDPFCADIKGDDWIKGNEQAFVDIKKIDPDFISFGALLLHFIGRPLCATGQFDEVQFVFYSFNDYASYVHGFPISHFPIRISTFLSEFTQACKTTTNMSLGRFIKLISSKFISSQTCEAYGLTSLYDSDKETGKLKLNKKFEDKTILKGEKDLRLQDAYGPQADIKFKVPRIRMQAECLTGKNASQSIYRIHIYDQNATSYSSLAQILKASESESLTPFTAGVAKAARAPDEDKSGNKEAFITCVNEALAQGILEAIPSTTSISESDLTKDKPVRFRVKTDFAKVKNYLRNIMPSLIYGSSTSNIIQANLASMNNPALTNINMRRSGLGTGTSALGLRESGLPLQIAPMQLSIETLGCPIALIGQQFFIDFGTGTSADNIYCCSKVSHSISAGSFTTNMSFQPLNSYGQYTNIGNAIDQAVAEITSDGD